MRKWLWKRCSVIQMRTQPIVMITLYGFRDDGQHVMQTHCMDKQRYASEPFEAFKCRLAMYQSMFNSYLSETCHCHVIPGTKASVKCKLHGNYLWNITSPDQMLPA